MGLYYDQTSTGAQWHLEFDHDKMIYRHYLNGAILFDKYITYSGQSRVLNRGQLKATASSDWAEVLAMSNIEDQKVYIKNSGGYLGILWQGAGWGAGLYFIDLTNYHIRTKLIAGTQDGLTDNLFKNEGSFSNPPVADVGAQQLTFNLSYSGGFAIYSFNLDW